MKRKREAADKRVRDVEQKRVESEKAAADRLNDRKAREAQVQKYVVVTEECSYLRCIDSRITQCQAQGPSRTCTATARPARPRYQREIIDCQTSLTTH